MTKPWTDNEKVAGGLVAIGLAGLAYRYWPGKELGDIRIVNVTYPATAEPHQMIDVSIEAVNNSPDSNVLRCQATSPAGLVYSGLATVSAGATQIFSLSFQMPLDQSITFNLYLTEVGTGVVLDSKMNLPITLTTAGGSLSDITFDGVTLAQGEYITKKEGESFVVSASITNTGSVGPLTMSYGVTITGPGPSVSRETADVLVQQGETVNNIELVFDLAIQMAEGSWSIIVSLETYDSVIFENGLLVEPSGLGYILITDIVVSPGTVAQGDAISLMLSGEVRDADVIIDAVVEFEIEAPGEPVPVWGLRFNNLSIPFTGQPFTMNILSIIPSDVPDEVYYYNVKVYRSSNQRYLDGSDSSTFLTVSGVPSVPIGVDVGVPTFTVIST